MHGLRPDLARTRELVLRHGWNATAYQLMNPGIRRWFAPGDAGVIGWVEASGYRVVAGAPVCAEGALADVVAGFEDEAHAARRRVCYFGAEARLADVLATRGPFDRVLLGAQPVWRRGGWQEALRRKASLRAQLHRARNKGVTTQEWQAAESADPRLRRCLEDWLATRGLPPLHFLVEPETLGRLLDRRLFVARRGEEVVAFLVAAPVPARHGWLIEQIVRGRGAVNGTNELLLAHAFAALERDGAEWLTLGLSPLSRRSTPDETTTARHRPALRVVLGGVRRFGGRFYDFDGLDAFKAKLVPQEWEPIWAITDERRFRLRTLYAIAGAFSGTSPLAFVARGLTRAARHALRLRSGRRPR